MRARPPPYGIETHGSNSPCRTPAPAEWVDREVESERLTLVLHSKAPGACSNQASCAGGLLNAPQQRSRIMAITHSGRQYCQHVRPGATMSAVECPGLDQALNSAPFDDPTVDACKEVIQASERPILPAPGNVPHHSLTAALNCT